MPGAFDRAGAEAIDPLASDPIFRATRLFDTCGNRVEIGAFLIAYAAEQRLRGAAYGAALGLAAAVAAFFYFRRKSA